jgi:hypothetical protein
MPLLSLCQTSVIFISLALVAPFPVSKLMKVTTYHLVIYQKYAMPDVIRR